MEEARLVSLAALVAQIAPFTMLAEIVGELKLIPDFELLRRATAGAPEGSRAMLSIQVVRAAAGQGKIPSLANALYRQLWMEPDAVGLIPYMERAADPAQQAALVVRANTMRLPNLRRFLMECEQRICVIAACIDGAGMELGTGFLVGPDWVLTAYHTLARHIDGELPRDPTPGKLFAIFDHFDGEPVEGPPNWPAGSIVVPFANDWLLGCSENMPGDGEIDEPDAVQVLELQRRLDFALVKLRDPVGLQSRLRATGGQRRLWFKLDEPAGGLMQDHRVIIPQHPGGNPQRIDFGRFSQAASSRDSSQTRFRYDTETAPGTSGAPCFSQNFQLVGLHNATFKVNGSTVANQAVRLSRILVELNKLQLEWPAVGTAPPSAATPLWSVAFGSSTPSVILGRRPLIDWIDAAVEAGNRRQRIYAASCRGEGERSTEGFGKSFSIQILKAARWGTAEPIIVLGSKNEQLPQTAPDVLHSIADQLSIPKNALDSMPHRPSITGSVNGGNDDKLSDWSSKDLPKWFAEVLGRHREVRVDMVAKAREAKVLLEQLGEQVPQSVLEVAAEGAPREAVNYRWDRVWIAIDRIAEGRVSDEVLNLLAGLTGGQLAEASVSVELRRLRWLFLGWHPLDAEDVTAELLDPAKVGEQEIIDAFQALAAAHAQDVDVDKIKLIRSFWKAMAGPMEGGAAEDPTRRLPVLQKSFEVIEEELWGTPGMAA